MIIIFTTSYFVGILWHIIVCDLQSQPTQWIIGEDGESHPTFETFCSANFNEEQSSFDRLVIVWYYAITTLSTIGYGDFHPISFTE